MSNKLLLKKSSVAAKVPLTSDLDYGELALNYADGKIYFKNSSNVIKSFTIDDNVVTLASTQTLTNKTLTSPTINGGALSGTFSGAITLSDTTAATSTTTGALKIGGGLGVAGTIYADQIRLINNGNGTNVYVGDDTILGDVNISNTLSIRGQQDATKGYIVFGNSNTTAYIGRDGTNPITVYGGQLSVSGTATGNSAIMLQLNGYTNKGGTGYHDFLSATNTYASAVNPSKFFRIDSAGTLQIINSAYTANIFNLTDAGELTILRLNANGTGTGTSGQVLTSTGTGLQWSSAGSGSVTSVGLSLPNIFTVTGSPVTVSGTLTATLASQTANTFFAAPNGTAGAPTFRAIVAADIPTLNQNTTGSAATLTTARTINGIAFNGSANIVITAVNPNDLTIGSYLTGTSYSGASAVTIAVDATSTNTASKVVARDASGNFAANVVTVVDLNSTSDKNLKDNIEPISEAIGTINKLNGVSFNWKEDGKKSYGFIAQEIEQILPDLVNENSEGVKSVSYIPVIAFLVEAIKEQQRQIEELKSRVS